MASFGADKILLNESLFAFNNLIVATKNVVEKSKTSAIQKLIRQIKLLTKKKTSNELQADQNKRKSQKLLEEIELIKKLKYNTAVLFSFENEGATFPEILKDKLKTATAEEKVLARIALSKMVTQAIDKIKNDPKILTQGWKKIFIQYQARLEKRQNWKEKQKLIKVIEDKLKTAEDVLSADAADSAEKEEGAEEEEEEENVLEEIPDDEEEKETKETTTLPPQIPKSAPVSSPTKKIIADKIEKAAAVVKKDTKATKPAPLPKKEKVVVTEKSKLQQKFKQLDKDDPGTKKLATKDRKSIIEMFAQTRDVKFSDDESSEDDEESEESAENDENSPNEDEDDDSDEEGQKSEDEEEDSDSNVIQEFNFNDLVKRTLHKSAEVKKTLKPLVFDKKPAEMEIRQLNLDDLNDLDEIPMYKKKKVNSISDQDNEMDSDEEEEDSDEEESEEEEEEDESPKKKRKRTESSEDESTVKSTKVTKQQQDPFFLDKNGNEVEAGHDYYRNNRSFDQEESNYVGYDGGYRSNYDKEAFKNKRNSLNSSFTSSLSSDRRPNQITDTPYYHNSERGGRGGSRGGFNSASSRGGYERRDGFQPRGGGGFDRGGRGRGGFSSDRGSFGGGRGGFSSERGGGYERGGFAAGRGNPFRGNSSSSFAGAQQRHQPQPPTLDVSKLHPSWQAKKQNEDKLKAMKFEGKKMKFDD